jgi:hypothetical protein
VYVRYPLEDDDGGALRAAHKRWKQIAVEPRKHLPVETRQEILTRIPGILDQTMEKKEETRHNE